jgi:hypothetical protein
VDELEAVIKELAGSRYRMDTSLGRLKAKNLIAYTTNKVRGEV